MRVVLDTNVLVSALLTRGGSAHQVIQLILRGDLQPCVDGRIVDEYRDVLARGKFSFSPQAVDALLEALLLDAQEVLPAPVAGRLVDEADRAFLEVAAAVDVEAVITGNVRHFHAARSLGIPVLTPGEFLVWRRRT